MPEEGEEGEEGEEVREEVNSAFSKFRVGLK